MAALGAGTDLDVASIVAEARAQTALDDLGDEGAFLERMRVYLAALDRRGRDQAGGRLVAARR